MTKLTLTQLIGWTIAGGLIGGGVSLLPIPPVSVALIAAGLAALSLTGKFYGTCATLLAAIVALSPAIMPDLPAWAALFISAVIYLVSIDLIERFA